MNERYLSKSPISTVPSVLTTFFWTSSVKQPESQWAAIVSLAFIICIYSNQFATQALKKKKLKGVKIKETDRAEEFANKMPERANSRASVHTKQTSGHILREKKKHMLLPWPIRSLILVIVRMSPNLCHPVSAIPWSSMPADRLDTTLSHCKWLSTCLWVLVTQVCTVVEPLKELATHCCDIPADLYSSISSTGESACKMIKHYYEQIIQSI